MKAVLVWLDKAHGVRQLKIDGRPRYRIFPNGHGFRWARDPWPDDGQGGQVRYGKAPTLPGAIRACLEHHHEESK